MINGQPRRLEMFSDDIRCNADTINYNSTLSKKEIPKAFENVFPVLVTSQIVVTNMKIEKSNGVENRINR